MARVPPLTHTHTNTLSLSLRQLCTWRISAEEGHVIRLSFRNFSLEAQDVCDFDYLEIHDSADTGAGRVLGRCVCACMCVCV